MILAAVSLPVLLYYLIALLHGSDEVALCHDALAKILCLSQSVFTESFASRWDHWLVAKLLSGMGVGMLQSTMPVYLSEIAPTQLRGFYINAYSL